MFASGSGASGQELPGLALASVDTVAGRRIGLFEGLSCLAFGGQHGAVARSSLVKVVCAMTCLKCSPNASLLARLVST